MFEHASASSLSWPNNILLYGYTAFYLHQSMDICLVPTLELLRIMLLRTRVTLAWFKMCLHHTCRGDFLSGSVFSLHGVCTRGTITTAERTDCRGAAAGPVSQSGVGCVQSEVPVRHLSQEESRT